MAKVLIVDDEKDARSLIKAILENEGFNVDEAEDGKSCLNKMSKANYDVVLLDIMMPSLSGEDVLAMIRKKGYKTPIIYVTVKSKDELKGGNANGFIQKPFKNEELAKLIKKVMKKE